MKNIYTVYQLNEKRNKLGNPYIGFTENLSKRAKRWQYVLKLDYTPELIPLYFSTEDQQAFDWEQDKRVDNGWRREKSLSHLKKITINGAVAASKSKKVKENAKQVGKKRWKELLKDHNQHKKLLDAAAKAKAVISKDIVEKIKKEYLDNKTTKYSISYCKLGKKYNVSGQTVARILKGRQGKEYTNFKD